MHLVPITNYRSCQLLASRKRMKLKYLRYGNYLNKVFKHLIIPSMYWLQVVNVTSKVIRVDVGKNELRSLFLLIKKIDSPHDYPMILECGPIIMPLIVFGSGCICSHFQIEEIVQDNR